MSLLDNILVPVVRIQRLDRSGRRPNYEFVRFDVLRHNASGTRDRTVADFDRCDQHRVRTDPNIITDLCSVLILAIVIAGHGPGTDVRVLTDGRVAEIGEMT